MKRRLTATIGIIAGLCTLVTSEPVNAADSTEQALINTGRYIVVQKCQRCHAVGRTDSSARKDAPAFRTLAGKYPVQFLAEALAEGITTGHNDMPAFVFEPNDIDAILAYLASISETSTQPATPGK